MLERIKTFLIRNFERVFIFVVLVSIALINYYIPYKIAFLNFFYIPILLAAYYLGKRNTLYGAVLCIFIAFIFAYRAPESFFPGNTKFDVFFNISTWACFLMLTGIILGAVQERLLSEYKKIEKLNMDLDQNEKELRKANESLLEN